LRCLHGAIERPWAALSMTHANVLVNGCQKDSALIEIP
jgi:hypothetical protein